jgi:hypothetical protein
MNIIMHILIILLQIIPVFVPIVVTAVLAATFAFIAATYWHNKGTKEKIAAGIAKGHEDLLKRMGIAESQLALLNQAVVPLNTAFQDHLVKMLTHHHTPRVDLLLSKLKNPKEMSDKETEELRVALHKRTTDMGDRISPEERIAASILADIVKLTALQANDIHILPFQLKLVSVEPDKKEKVCSRTR